MARRAVHQQVPALEPPRSSRHGLAGGRRRSRANWRRARPGAQRLGGAAARRWGASRRSWRSP
eukprot:2515356-Lingulodinium_polyedra.AAC.1